jgi:pimeloyl-ACP methyl ester carboxylesterase
MVYVVAVQGVSKERLSIQADLYIGPPWDIPDLPEDCHLIGHSFGAYKAMEYAAKRPVKALTLVAPVGLEETIGIWGWFWALLFTLLPYLPCLPSWLPERRHLAYVASHVTVCPARWKRPLGHTLGSNVQIICGEFDTLGHPPSTLPYVTVKDLGHSFTARYLDSVQWV